ncbi:Cytochrome b/b6 domain protein [Sulfolobus islandicus L.S.2.15]|jgi:quinol-cytochrome oxidoreductase complex cytochrome b subunit|uniref:Cytochrome b/b6 domain protein n=3 Tax=Saccharolobus islandicus TaxID=43080 RepID=C3MMN6_SACI2|nr:proton pump complex cytochrome B SoxC [Sulfolobus islandicus]ACP36753.1 Cytochrome b/b6 domain protein [Sulfolobus islandicus L.S.2.15]ACP49906.1 Cytochrome b/b6 domain protein [Sulfolobus islandicus Y.N.15.51]ADB88569.1 Cytochrome b/b6, N-terminal domain protein [Sulfolobus islandicus L.D.8.5]PVU77043.1 cytochrome bc complex cytochrome b subunit [Sulfolobus islandicus]
MGEEKKGIIDTIIDRVGVTEAPLFKTPDYMYNLSYWLGAMVSAAFIYTVITGLFLLMYYQPAFAYQSTQSIISSVPYGPVLLFSHLYGSYIMIILAYIHMFRNFYKGAYKKPRELQWITGVILLLLTLGASFFGYSLVSDVLGVNAIDIGDQLLVGTGIPGATTIVGWLFGPGGSAALSSDPLVRSELFDRLLGWHILLVFLLGALFLFHFMLAERYGMTPSAKDKPKVPAYYTKEEQQRFNEWWPRNFVYMLSVVLLTWGIILFVPNLLANINGLPIVINPYPAPQAGSPESTSVQPYPPWFFLFLYKFVDFLLPNGMPITPILVLAVLIIGLLVLIFLPFLDPSDDLRVTRRKFWTWIVSTLAVYLIELSVWGYLEPGVPVPFSQEIEYLGLPLIVIGILVYLWPVKQNNTPITRTETKVIKMNITPMEILLASVSALSLAGTFVNFLEFPTIINGIILIPVGLFTLYMLRRVAAFIVGKKPVAAVGSSVAASWNKKAAFYGIVIIFIVSLFLLGLMWTLPSIGPQSTYAGMDLGVILMLWGIAVQLYHYEIYVK